jgi:hypothetical protein
MKMVLKIPLLKQTLTLIKKKKKIKLYEINNNVYKSVKKSII